MAYFIYYESFYKVNLLVFVNQKKKLIFTKTKKVKI